MRQPHRPKRELSLPAHLYWPAPLVRLIRLTQTLHDYATPGQAQNYDPSRTPTPTSHTPRDPQGAPYRALERRYLRRIDHLADELEDDIQLGGSAPRGSKCQGCGQWRRGEDRYCGRCGHQIAS